MPRSGGGAKPEAACAGQEQPLEGQKEKPRVAIRQQSQRRMQHQERRRDRDSADGRIGIVGRDAILRRRSLMPFVGIGVEAVLQKPHAHDAAAKIGRPATRRIDEVEAHAYEKGQ